MQTGEEQEVRSDLFWKLACLLVCAAGWLYLFRNFHPVIQLAFPGFLVLLALVLVFDWIFYYRRRGDHSGLYNAIYMLISYVVWPLNEFSESIGRSRGRNRKKWTEERTRRWKESLRENQSADDAQSKNTPE